MFIPVEKIYDDMSSALITLPFKSDEARGTVRGLLGRLINEPSIAEDDQRKTFTGYQPGVTYLERIEILKKLLEIFKPLQGHQEIDKFITSLEEELFLNSKPIKKEKESIENLDENCQGYQTFEDFIDASLGEYVERLAR